VDRPNKKVLIGSITQKQPDSPGAFDNMGGDPLGSVIKKRRKKMRKHKHRKLLARTRHQRRKGK
jgi:hypothetical protein